MKGGGTFVLRLQENAPKMEYKEVHAQIKAVINALDKEDQAKFYEEAQEEGF